MKRLSKRIEKLMMAVTFAEAGEHDIARELMKEDEETDRLRPSKRQDKTLRASSPQQ